MAEGNNRVVGGILILAAQLPVIHRKIYEVRGQRVRLDFDPAELYEVETRSLNQAVRKNISSQFVMTYSSKHPKNALPLAFTEHGVTILANGF